MAEIELKDNERTKCEVWKDIKGYEGLYQVSNFGRVKSLERNHHIVLHDKDCLRHQKERIMKQWKRSSYWLVDLWDKGKRDIRAVHHLVFETFYNRQIGGFFVHHIDENKENNCAYNLELITCKDHNKLHHGGKPSWNKGLKMPPEPFIKMSETKTNNLRPRNIQIINLANIGKKTKELSAQFGICARHIQQILKEKEKWLIN